MIRSGIFSTGSSRSTKPEATALNGISANGGRVTFEPCAMVSPPCSLIAFSPSVPSFPPPDNTTPIACCLILGQRDEEDIDRRSLAIGAGGASQLQASAADGQDRAGG